MLMMSVARLGADERPSLERHLMACAINQQRSESDHSSADIGESPLTVVVVDEATQEQQREEEETRSVQCECCGMAEDCTAGYVSRVRGRFHGRWVCGLCAEAVSERRRREPALTVGEAVESHASLCSRFNTTVRLNPTLSLARSMRDIARGSCLSRRRSPSPPSVLPAACAAASKIGKVGYVSSPAKQAA